MEITPLNPNLGSEVTGLELRKLSDDQFEQLHQMFLDRCVFVVRDQYLDVDDLIEFASRWGKLFQLPGALASGRINTLTNQGKAESQTEAWHVDVTFLPAPWTINILAAQRLPAIGGDTMFANQYLAYETLSDGMKQLLSGLRAVHQTTTPYARAAWPDHADVPMCHPVVRTHPETGRKSLYVNGLWTTGIEGMTVAESRGLLDFLYQHAVSPEFVYRHRWHPGDVLMWDNRCVMHYAVHDHGDAERTILRALIGGPRPE